jgi:hypothetical protein
MTTILFKNQNIIIINEINNNKTSIDLKISQNKINFLQLYNHLKYNKDKELCIILKQQKKCANILWYLKGNIFLMLNKKDYIFNVEQLFIILDQYYKNNDANNMIKIYLVIVFLIFIYAFINVCSINFICSTH